MKISLYVHIKTIPWKFWRKVLLTKNSRNSSRFWKQDLSWKTQRFPVIIKRTGNSLDKKCTAFGCSGRSFCLVNKERKATGISFFNFPNSKQKLTTDETWLKDKMAKKVLLSRKIQHIHARNIFMLQIYTEALAVHGTL